MAVRMGPTAATMACPEGFLFCNRWDTFVRAGMVGCREENSNRDWRNKAHTDRVWGQVLSGVSMFLKATAGFSGCWCCLWFWRYHTWGKKLPSQLLLPVPWKPVLPGEAWHWWMEKAKSEGKIIRQLLLALAVRKTYPGTYLPLDL